MIRSAVLFLFLFFEGQSMTTSYCHKRKCTVNASPMSWLWTEDHRIELTSFIASSIWFHLMQKKSNVAKLIWQRLIYQSEKINSKNCNCIKWNKYIIRRTYQLSFYSSIMWIESIPRLLSDSILGEMRKKKSIKKYSTILLKKWLSSL